MLPSSLERIRRFQQRYAPWIALTLGCLARALSKRGVDFAPKAVGLLAVAWILPVIVARWAPENDPGWRGKLRGATGFVVMALFRNVLFFLVPIWFGSATVRSLNIVFPLLLAAMALVSCFPDLHRRWVLDRPATRTLWSALVLFAALVPAAAVVISLSPRLAVALAAAVAFPLTCAALIPRDQLRSRPLLARIIAGAAAGALALTLLTPVLPPVPLVCHAAATGSAVTARNLEGPADTFPAGTHRVYAWFAVTLPSIYRQGINFQWRHDGKRAGRPIASSVTGGRKEGYRTWSYLTAPARGAWTADLLTDAGQLICRTSFDVE